MPRKPGRRVVEILRLLEKRFPDARCELDYRSPLELLVAVILSAQCTDERVNQITPVLFQRYLTAQDYAQAPPGELEELVRPAGYFNQKARYIREATRLLVERHQGEVPCSFDALLALPGVARKTANVLMGVLFGVATGIVVDTHVKRVAYRLRLSDQKDPVKVEQDLMRHIPRDQWISASHRLVHLGRYLCKARRPLCGECPLSPLCPRRME